MQQVDNKKKSPLPSWDDRLPYITKELERPAPQYYIDKVPKIYKDYFEYDALWSVRPFSIEPPGSGTFAYRSLKSKFPFVISSEASYGIKYRSKRDGDFRGYILASAHKYFKIGRDPKVEVMMKAVDNPASVFNFYHYDGTPESLNRPISMEDDSITYSIKDNLNTTLVLHMVLKDENGASVEYLPQKIVFDGNFVDNIWTTDDQTHAHTDQSDLSEYQEDDTLFCMFATDDFENYYAHLKPFDTGLHTISFHSRWNGAKAKKKFLINVVD
jgi:hypothetical protein